MIDSLSISSGVKSFSDRQCFLQHHFFKPPWTDLPPSYETVLNKCKSQWLMVKSAQMSSTRQCDWNEVAFVPASGLTWAEAHPGRHHPFGGCQGRCMDWVPEVHTTVAISSFCLPLCHLPHQYFVTGTKDSIFLKFTGEYLDHFCHYSTQTFYVWPGAWCSILPFMCTAA